MTEAEIIAALTAAIESGAPAEERKVLTEMLLAVPAPELKATPPRFINYANLAKRGDAEERCLIRAEIMTMDY